MRKPFYRKQTKSWYVKDDQGRFILLGKTKTDAYRQWKAMLACGDASPDRITLVTLCDEFLAEHENLMSADRWDDFQRVSQSLCDALGAAILASKVTTGKVTSWMQAEKPGRLRKDGTTGKPITWSATRQRDAGSLIRQVYRWGVETGRVARNPLAGLRLPSPNIRSGVIDPELHSKLVEDCLRSTRSRSFAIYLIASHCGARPQQIREITADHCSPDFRFAEFVEHKTSRHTGKPLRVYFSPCLQTLLRILASKRPKGRLFLNDSGNKWTKDSASRRFRRLREKLGIERSTVLYLYRHTLATDALLSGQSEAVTAALLGHKSSEMVRRIYNQINHHDDELSAAAAKAAAKRMEKDGRASG
ncbi:MAG: tyrosine-type recombinase/integrase [Novipirellula sp. JB048]